MMAGDAEDDVVGGEVDLDHDVAVGHLFEQRLRVVLVHDVDAVADAFGVAEVDGLADVEAEGRRVGPGRERVRRRGARCAPWDRRCGGSRA